MSLSHLLQNAKAIIFDMDGVLVDNKQYHDAAWIQFAKKYGTRQIDNFDTWLLHQAGKTTEAILESLFGQKPSPNEIARYSQEKEQVYRQLYAGNVVAVEGLHSFLNHLKAHSVPLAIATSGSLENVSFVVEALSIATYFSHIVHADMLTHSKPHPEAYLTAAKLLQINPADCLVFEDSLAGVQSARAAGMRVIGLSTSLPQAELLHVGAERVFDSFSKCEEYYTLAQ